MGKISIVSWALIDQKVVMFSLANCLAKKLIVDLI